MAQGHSLPLDHYLICHVKDQLPVAVLGEGCIALQSGATESQVPIRTVLTHHGEKTGFFQGEFKLQTSQGKQREKLYGKAPSYSCPIKNSCDAFEKVFLTDTS